MEVSDMEVSDMEDSDTASDMAAAASLVAAEGYLPYRTSDAAKTVAESEVLVMD
jgi:hypothetical protein